MADKKEAEGMEFLADYFINGNIPENPEDLRKKFSQHFGSTSFSHLERKKQPGLLGGLKRLFGRGGWESIQVSIKDKISSISNEDLHDFFEKESKEILKAKSEGIFKELFPSHESEEQLLGNLFRSNFDLWTLAKKVSNSPTFKELPEDKWIDALYDLVYMEQRRTQKNEFEQPPEQKELLAFFTHPAESTSTKPYVMWEDRYVMTNLKGMMKLAQKSNAAEITAIDNFLKYSENPHFTRDYNYSALSDYLLEAYAKEEEKSKVALSKAHTENRVALVSKTKGKPLEERLAKGSKMGTIQPSLKRKKYQIN